MIHIPPGSKALGLMSNISSWCLFLINVLPDSINFY